MSDSFLQAMTFATLGENIQSCDCDECETIPPSILAAIRERKRQKLETTPLKRTQQRTLSVRSGSISIWNLVMPLHAEPLVEFGTSHRIVWVKRLDHTQNSIQSIGKGIIGSSDEEKSRYALKDWEEGSIFLIPSNGGKAVGWVHTMLSSTMAADDGEARNMKAEQKDKGSNKDDNAETSTNSGNTHAILYITKVPMEKLDVEQETNKHTNDKSTEPDWIQSVINYCRLGLQKINAGNNQNSDKKCYYKFSESDSKTLVKVLQEAEKHAQAGPPAQTSGGGGRPEIPTPRD